MYTDVYERIRSIDNEKANYYIVYRLVRALIEGKEGQEIWRRSDIVHNIINELQVMTGISVTI
jgi:hypothetical protein